MYPDIFESATFSFRSQEFSRPHVIAFVADLFFSTLDLESGFKKYSDSSMRVEGSLIPERKSCEFKNVRIRVDGAPVNEWLLGIGCVWGEWKKEVIQLFRQRLSHKSVKANATMPIGIMGRKSLALID